MASGDADAGPAGTGAGRIGHRGAGEWPARLALRRGRHSTVRGGPVAWPVGGKVRRGGRCPGRGSGAARAPAPRSEERRVGKDGKTELAITEKPIEDPEKEHA